MAMYRWFRPFLFRVQPETAHDQAKYMLKHIQKSDSIRSRLRSKYQYEHPALHIDAFGLSFRNPVGIAPGFDKNGEIAPILSDIGFGNVTIGSVTPKSQQGHPKPRLFRLPKDKGLIDYMGLPSKGAKQVRSNLASMKQSCNAPVGVVIEKMNNSGLKDGIADYRRVFETLSKYGDYFVIGICPNTPDGFHKNILDYMELVFEEISKSNRDNIPLLLKIGHIEHSNIEGLIDLAESWNFDGFIVGGRANNTTIKSKNKNKLPEGTIHGQPVQKSALSMTKRVYKSTDLPIIGVGGINSARSAYQRIKAGATLLQLYTHFIYQGPTTAWEINKGIVEYLNDDRYQIIEDAIGESVK